MNVQKNFEYFMNLDYNAVLKKAEGRFYLFIPELSLLAEGSSLSQAYKNLEKKKAKYFKDMIKLNAQETVKEPVLLTVRRKLFNEVIMFFVKALIIVAICVLIFLGSLPILTRVLSQMPNRATEVIVVFSDRLKNMPEENKKKLRLKFRQMAQELKPMTDELRILWEDEDHENLD